MIGPRDSLDRARVAVTVGTTALLRGDWRKALEAVCTAHHLVGASVWNGTPLDGYAEVVSLVSTLQLHLARFIDALGSSAA